MVCFVLLFGRRWYAEFFFFFFVRISRDDFGLIMLPNPGCKMLNATGMYKFPFSTSPEGS